MKAATDDIREDALRKVLRPDLPTVIQNNRAFHQRLREGVEVAHLPRECDPFGVEQFP